MSRVPECERWRIVALSLQAYSQRRISMLTNRPLSTVNRIVRAYRKERRIKGHPRTGRPKVTNEDDDMNIVAASLDKPTASATEIKNTVGLLGVPNATVKRRLRAAGLRSRIAAQKPLVSVKNKGTRLAFARDHQQWTEEHWGKVVFTDESAFTTRWDQRQRVWRLENCRYICLSTCSKSLPAAGPL
ncbi:uncharacterized protein LOC142558047 [Dermacentor variabilis]|uniref:uncharacterized protein LOC142558047 n=1 Tax=Dermacentor variabilis TaxID=34621 RepID=UPI003F5B6BD6